MYHDIVAAHGQLISFGMDFSQKLLSHHSSIFVAIPFLLLVVGSVGLQYLQMSRLNKRNGGAAQANPQAAMLQKYMPLIFGFIYINVAAILNVYFIVSSAIRIATQEILFRRGMVGGPPPSTVDATATEKKKPKGPVVDRTERALPKPKTGSASAAGTAKKKAPPARSGGSGGSNANGRTRRPVQTAADVDATATVKRAGSTGGTNGKRTPSSTNGNGSRRGPAKPSGNGSNGSNGSGGSATASSGSSAPKEHPRSKAKRERKAR